MIVYAFDAESNGKWSKDWSTLSRDITPLETYSQVKSKALNLIEHDCLSEKSVIVLVHQRECEASVRAETFTLIANYKKLFVMYVSGSPEGAEKPEGNLSPRIHYSSTTFDNHKNLSHLSNKFKSLCESLDSSENENQIKESWQTFEQVAFPEELVAVYLLLIAHQKNGAIPLTTISNEQWQVAFQQYNSLSKDDSVWPKVEDTDVSTLVENIKNTLAKLSYQTA